MNTKDEHSLKVEGKDFLQVLQVTGISHKLLVSDWLSQKLGEDRMGYYKLLQKTWTGM